MKKPSIFKRGCVALFLVAWLSLLAVPASAQDIVPERIGSVSWSPDGTELLVAASNGIFVYGRDNTLLRYRIESIDYAYFFNGWKPDGTQFLLGRHIIARQTLQTIKEISGARGWINGGQQIFRLKSDVMNNFRTTIEIVNVSDSSVAWTIPTIYQIEDTLVSPDTTKVATAISNALIVFDVNQREVIFEYNGESFIGRYTWSPDGNQIAFTERINPQSSRLVVANLTNQTIRSSSDPIELISLAWGKDQVIGVTQTGDFTTGYLYILSLFDDRTLDRISHSQIGSTFDGGSIVSPFGGVIVFLRPMANSLISGLDIFVLTATLDRFAQIAASCGAPNTLTDFDTSLTDPAAIAAQAQALLAQLDALPENAIPAGCAADLRAIAEAIMPPPGSYTLTATPYSEPDGQGTEGFPLTVNFTVVGE